APPHRHRHGLGRRRRPRHGPHAPRRGRRGRHGGRRQRAAGAGHAERPLHSGALRLGRPGLPRVCGTSSGPPRERPKRARPGRHGRYRAAALGARALAGARGGRARREGQRERRRADPGHPRPANERGPGAPEGPVHRRQGRGLRGNGRNGPGPRQRHPARRVQRLGRPRGGEGRLRVGDAADDGRLGHLPRVRGLWSRGLGAAARDGHAPGRVLRGHPARVGRVGEGEHAPRWLRPARPHSDGRRPRPLRRHRDPAPLRRRRDGRDLEPRTDRRGPPRRYRPRAQRRGRHGGLPRAFCGDPARRRRGV
ncbi:MAG: Inosine-uridine preferring nucleoside hydrolase, partial [uncultured Rubrobacteraceae bacterium]